MGAVFERQVVHAGGPIGGGLGGVGVAEHDGRGAQDLHVHAVAVHLRNTQLRVPQGGVHRAELAVARHDLAGGAVGIRAQPGRVDRVQRRRFLPRDRRKEVGVHVDFLNHGGLCKIEDARGRLACYVACGVAGSVAGYVACGAACCVVCCVGAWPLPGCIWPQPGQVRFSGLS
ncbi:hypothetical protein D3C87_1660610 [compost metagenome]